MGGDNKLAKAADKRAKYELKQKLKQEHAVVSEKVKDSYIDPTKPGDKKILQDFGTSEFKIYIPSNVGSSWYSYWQNIGVFTENGYPVIGFPDKLNGVGHLGNAFHHSIIDCLARYLKMQSREVSVPHGYSDGGILLEDALETKILDDKTSKYSIDRNAFISQVSGLKTINHGHIQKQLAQLGTLNSKIYENSDENVKHTISQYFALLNKKGLVERRPSMINWSYYLHSPVPDTDIKYVNIKGRTPVKVPGYEEDIEFGVINDIVYPVEKSDDKLIIATTKPETMFADVAIAIHPLDDRYRHLAGKNVIHPITGRLLPVIFDDELVNIEFGTGAVRLAPSNNIKDYKIGLKHGLEFIQIFNEDGTLNDNCGDAWKGIKRLESRKRILQYLKEKGLFLGAKDNPMRIQISLKTGDVIEKRLHNHWWFQSSKCFSTTAVDEKLLSLNVQPSEYLHKIQAAVGNLKSSDLMLSTEKILWKTCPINAYFIKLPHTNPDTAINDNQYWVVSNTEKEAETIASQKYKDFELVRDNDSFDSWFFDSLYPLISSKPPHALLVSSVADLDIEQIARSIVISLAVTGELPFQEILFHPLVTDFNNRKLSKRLGNAFDPLDVIEGHGHKEIADGFARFAVDNLKELKKLTKAFQTKFPKGFNEIGADAFRVHFLSKIHGHSLEENFALNNLADIDNDKKTISKIYQLVKFVIIELNNNFKHEEYSNSCFTVENIYDKWIIHKLQLLVSNSTQYWKNKDLSSLIKDINSFWLNCLNDVYFEIVKNKLLSLHEDSTDKINSKRLLYYIVDTVLKLYHPIAPFVTEELWQKLSNNQYKTICSQQYPQETDNTEINEADAEDFVKILDLSSYLGQMINNYGIPKNNEVIVRVSNNEKLLQLIHSNHHILNYLNRKVSLVTIIGDDADILNEQDYVRNVCNHQITVYLLIRGNLDVSETISKNKAKLAKIRKQKQNVESLQKADNYTVKASGELQQKHKSQVHKFSNEIKLLEEVNDSLEKLSLDSI